jgi:hypothetical protein
VSAVRVALQDERRRVPLVAPEVEPRLERDVADHAFVLVPDDLPRKRMARVEAQVDPAARNRDLRHRDADRLLVREQ